MRPCGRNMKQQGTDKSQHREGPSHRGDDGRTRQERCADEASDPGNHRPVYTRALQGMTLTLGAMGA